MDMVPAFVAAIAFFAVVGIVYVAGRYLAAQLAMSRRLPTPAVVRQDDGDIFGAGLSKFFSALANRIDERKFGIDGLLRNKLRRDLVRAGYFSDDAIRYYLLMRIALILLLPSSVFVFAQIFLGGVGTYLNLVLVAVSALIAIVAVDAYVKRRQRRLQQDHRTVFPDVVDMLVVCIDAGLSLDAAIARIAPEIAKQSSSLGTNLIMFGAETRAGRSTTDALGSFADRLNLDEVRAFAIMLRQSVELGTDIANALRVFSDETRAKRLLRAEATANQLPVKMVVPLGACIFPVILMVVMVPVVIRLMSVMR